MTINQQEIYLDKIRQEYMDLVYSVFSHDLIPSHGYSGGTFHASLATKNYSYIHTPYFYKEDLKFIHWTSLQNLFSILNNREFRFYNLHSSTDKHEFEYAAQQLTIPREHIDYSKQYLYTLSFCKDSEIDNIDLWAEYGGDYKGIAIQFEIINSPTEWDNFMIAPIKYELPQELIELKIKLDNLKSKYPAIKTILDLGRLIAFHKMPQRSKELEIRLATYFPFDNTEAYWKYCNTEFRFDNERPRITNYFGLKLWVDNDSAFVKSKNPEYDRRLLLPDNYFKTRPKIVIRNIFFGEKCGVKNIDYLKFRTKLMELFRLKFGYKIELPLKLHKIHTLTNKTYK